MSSAKSESEKQTLKNCPQEHVDSRWEKSTFWWKHYVFGSAEGMRKYTAHKYLSFGSSILRGFGQVTFVDNPWSGLLTIIALALSTNYRRVLLAIIGGIINQLTATLSLRGRNKLLLDDQPNYLNNGIFVYNGALTGMGMGLFLEKLDWWTFLKMIFPVCVFGHVATAIHLGLTNVFPNHPVFTIPFNLSTLIWLHVPPQLSWIPGSNKSLLLSKFVVTARPKSLNFFKLFQGVFIGVSQIHFGDTFAAGIVYFFAIFLSDWISALLALLGSFIGLVTALLFGLDIRAIEGGLFGYNTALTALACGRIFAHTTPKNIVNAIYHCILCMFIHLFVIGAVAHVGLPAMTVPFNITMLFFSVFAFRRKQEQEKKIALKKKEKELAGKSRFGKDRSLDRTVSLRGAPQFLGADEATWDKLDTVRSAGTVQLRSLTSVSESAGMSSGRISPRGAPAKLAGDDDEE